MTKIDESREAECRAAFEAHCRKSLGFGSFELRKENDIEGAYCSDATQSMWYGWKSAMNTHTESARDGHGGAVGAEKIEQWKREDGAFRNAMSARFTADSDDSRRGDAVAGHACRESDRAMVATPAGQELIGKAAQHLRSESAHKFFGAGEIDCPKEIKASNGELHTLRCRICGLDNPKSTVCYGDSSNANTSAAEKSEPVENVAEDTYWSIADMLEPHITRIDGHTGEVINAGFLPASIYESVQILLDHALYNPIDNTPLEQRMKAAGMYSIEELLSTAPLNRFHIHSGMDSLETFEKWLEMKAIEYTKMHARFTLDRREDELFEWVLAHAGVFKEVLLNFKAATGK